jgi:hypothetical protein
MIKWHIDDLKFWSFIACMLCLCLVSLAMTVNKALGDPGGYQITLENSAPQTVEIYGADDDAFDAVSRRLDFERSRHEEMREYNIRLAHDNYERMAEIGDLQFRVRQNEGELRREREAHAVTRLDLEGQRELNAANQEVLADLVTRIEVNHELPQRAFADVMTQTPESAFPN